MTTKTEILHGEIERLERENGALARTYAACEQVLRERTEIVNLLQSEVAALSAENERLRGALERILAHYNEPAAVRHVAIDTLVNDKRA